MKSYASPLGAIWAVVSLLLASPAISADLLIHNAQIWTADNDTPNATAMAVEGDRIVAIGGDEVVEAHRASAETVMDAEQRFIVPGFIDTHVHFLSSSYGLTAVQLRDAATPEEFVSRIRQKAESLPPGSWILEGYWDHTLWGGELPRADWIDEFTPNNPVWISRLDGHMALANTRAMELAGVTAATADVEGGEIVRQADGTPAGVFKDNAMPLIAAAIPDPSPEENDKAFLNGMRHVASNGVTTVHNMDQASLDIIERYERIKHHEITRFYLAVELEHWEALAQHIAENGSGDEWLRLGVLKGMVDGSLGSHTAAFYEPYTDQPKDRGFFVLREQDLLERATAADAAGLHLAIHAIGDRSIGTLLDVYDHVRRENPARDRRWRIEHAQHLAPEQFARFQDLGVIASMQPYHAIDDGRWAERLIGPERIKTTYAFRSFLDSDVMLAFGSDWSVAPATPLEGIYAAVTRRTLDGANPRGWVPEEKISVEEALRAYTINGAYASFEEDIKGSLAPGKLADFVILDSNLFDVPEESLRGVRVLSTYVGGKQVFPQQSER